MNASLRVGGRELRDLAVAWLALGVAFTLFLDRSIVAGVFGRGGPAVSPDAVATTFGISLATVGVGFLLHELAHKVVAVRFDQVAEFRADYGMLFVAVAGGLAGFLFAAPGAVHHRGRITPRENGLIALAGPVANLGLAAGFFLLGIVGLELFSPLLIEAAELGVIINLLLAGFNMLPVGPLDGKTVLRWDRRIYAAVAVPSVALAVLALFGF